MKIHKIALITLITLLIGQTLINQSVIVGINQASAQTPQARKAEADKLNEQGIKQYQTSQFEAALRSWQQALMIYREIKDRKGEAKVLGNIGVAYHALGDYKKAIDYQQQKLAIARETRDRLSQGQSLGNLGNAYDALGDYKKAIDYHSESLAIAREIKNRLGEGQSLGNLGNAYHALGDYKKAIEYHSESLAIARDIKNQLGEGQSLGNLGNAYHALGDYKKAIEYHSESLAIAREIKNRLGEGQSLGNLGNAYHALGDYKKAIEYHSESLAIAREIKYRLGEGQSLGSLGLAYFSLGDYPKAIEYQQQRLAIAREIKDRLGEVQSLGNLGNAYYALGDYPKSIEYHSSSLAISREIQYRLGEGKTLANLGNTYYALGDYRKAIDFYSSSLAISHEIKDRLGEGQSLSSLGNAYHALGNSPKAIEYHSSSLDISREIKDRRGEGLSLGHLALAYNVLGEYRKAIEYYSSSLAITREIKDRLGEGAMLGNLGLTYYALGDYRKAIEYHSSSLVIARQIKNRNGEGRSLNNLGLAFYKQGNFPAAEQTLYEGIQVWESLRNTKLADTDKVSLFDTQSNTYRILQQVLIAKNKTDAALEIAERGRARAFVELLATRVSTNNKQADKSPQAPTIAQIKQIAQQQNATLVQYSIIGDNFKVAGKRQTKESDLYIWVIKPTGEVTFRKVDLKPLWLKDNTTLDELVTQSRLGIGVVRSGRAGGIVSSQNPDAAKVQKPLQKLHDILIKDIADLLPKNTSERVIFIPQGSLFLAPFPALRDEQGKYLIEKHTILTAPAIQVLDFTHQLNQGKTTNYNNALIVGNPNMPVVSTEPGKPATQLDPLPGAEQEAKTIADLLKTKAILGKDATKANILQRLSTADVIHLATHGWADDNRGLGSWIALAPSGKDNGLLTAEEILDLKLKAQLVVLSACETGKGKLSGDGVIGLSRSLISAGVPSVLVSLWQVPDAPTQYLMVEFYKSLQTQPDKALALRQAMLKTKEKFPNPVNWAAFTLIGER
ncbi:CHAT domain-containing protein [Tolypothrix sp. FACHB-123]|uniref:tetratricopeptide repeat protein n=1 Tax=Tolypothrix sp. FACHB-123 TaxID=2692868 RepID=UPI0016850754|nr:tetratricopeptide repeat protein [Tolypothrix sp. FACHB-123]MBD2355182.1 CHAT domain-containing protein [Tolypothrix sp. FACHB-123]